LLLSDEPLAVTPPGVRLYDLIEDAGETHDVLVDEPESAMGLLETYRDRLKPKYLRYVNAVTHEQPHSSFALAIKDFQIDPIKKTVQHPLDRPGYDRVKTLKGWILSNHWSKFWLLALETERSITADVRVPNGTYDVSVELMGSCTISLDRGDERPESLSVQGPPFQPSWDLGCERVTLGRVEVHDEIFELGINPHTMEGPVVIRLLGFTPVGKQASMASDDNSQLERLRALGYVE
jgi:hypothetical protein